ncbi:MAG: hypothetical protein E7164_01840 [Firmicutes bacterium]|nr:hypothetical protein [Bacillota bacterium]
MKDIIKYIGLLFLIVFSFYYTDKISTMIIYNSNLMKEIVNNKEKEGIPSENAVISGSFIVPGINGKIVNELDSYYQMKGDYLYQSSKLIFNEVFPEISLEQNKHLVINRANQSKKAVSIVVKDNSNIINYSEKEKIAINKLIKYEEFSKNSYFEQINNDQDMAKLDVLLHKYNMNTNICFVNDFNRNICKKGSKYLVAATYEVDNVSIIGLEIESGDIILISDNLSLANYKVLLKKIYYRDLDVVFLSRLISEKRNYLEES